MIGYAKLALLVGSVCLISFVLMDFRHTSPSDKVKVFQHNTSYQSNSHLNEKGWSADPTLVAPFTLRFYKRSLTLSQYDNLQAVCGSQCSVAHVMVIIFNSQFTFAVGMMLILSGSNSFHLPNNQVQLPATYRTLPTRFNFSHNIVCMVRKAMLSFI